MKRVCITIDVEDWFQSVFHHEDYPVETWPDKQITIEEPISFLLDSFEKNGVIATFFVLGWFGEHRPDLVKKIQDKGHEIASHGMTHVLNDCLDDLQLDYEVSTSKQILESVTGEPVLGYRATSYSISDRVAEKLFSSGYSYDSSLFPIRGNGMYGRLSPAKFEGLRTRGFQEIPIPVGSFWGLKTPFAGGTYFRLLPLWFIKKQVLISKSDPLVLYFHPRDLPNRGDTTGFLSFKNRVQAKTSFRSLGIKGNDKKILSLIEFLKKQGYRFVPMRDLL